MATEAWEQNACFTIRAESRERVDEIAHKLAAYARRIGAGELFCDYEGPAVDQGGEPDADH
jgi:hypothetical protein